MVRHTMPNKESKNLYTRLATHWQNPSAIFIEEPDGCTISYAEVKNKTAQMANTLVAMDVAPGDRVVARTKKSPNAILLYLACLRAGAVYVPLNPAYSLNELEYALNDANPKLVVTDVEDVHAVSALCQKINIPNCLTLGTKHDGTLLNKAQNQPTTFQNCAREPFDIAAILYTSGTTGRPKGAMLSHENLSSNAKVLTSAWRFTNNDTLVHALPIFHAHGLFVACNVIMTATAKMIFLEKFKTESVLKALPHATTMMGVPTFYTRLLNEPRFDKKCVKHMRLFVSGSAPLSADTHRAFFNRTGHQILERYGLTETGMNTSNPYDGQRKPGSVGPPLPGIKVRITDPETGTVLPNGDAGMIEVKGPNVFRGYWQQPEKTAQDFRKDGYFITGDLGRFDTDGYVFILDRAKDLIISGGLNVYPKEVELAISNIPGVSECAVIGRKHEDLGEAVTAVVVTADNKKLSQTDILKHLDQVLARYKHPKHFHFVDELPRNALGKIQKNILRELYQ